MTPVLVTGAGGYLGARVVRLLTDAGTDAVGVARADGDLTDREAARRLVAAMPWRAVVHAAAAVPRATAEYEAPRMRANAEMARALVDALGALSRPPLLVAISTLAVYGTHRDGVVEESDAPAPDHAYARGKLEAERIVLAASGALPVTVLRLPGLFGAPRRGGALYQAASAFAEGRAFALSSVPPAWSGMHVDDAAEVIVRAAHAGRAVGLVNVAYPDGRPLPRALAMLAEAFARPDLYREVAAPSFVVDPSRLRATLGLPASTLRERLEAMASALRSVA